MNSEASVKFLGVTIDHKLDLDIHISKLCKKTATKRNVLKGPKFLIAFEEKRYWSKALSSLSLTTVLKCSSSPQLDLWRRSRKYRNEPYDFDFFRITMIHLMEI